MRKKGKFRKFLWDNGFNCPHAKSYYDINEAIKDVEYFTWPVIVKPVDSAGSKGVTKVENIDQLEEAVKEAISESHNGQFIIEDFLTFKGYHSSADCFTVDGELNVSNSYSINSATIKNDQTSNDFETKDIGTL